MSYNADDIARMKAMQGEELASTRNLGGELLRAFEGGQPPQFQAQGPGEDEEREDGGNEAQ